eukprot:62454-Rhodomonas_salina.3
MTLSALQSQAMMGGMSGLPFHLPFASTLAPSALTHPFSLEQQHAAMSGLFSHGFFNTLAAPHAAMAFAGGHASVGKAARKRALPKASGRKGSTPPPH